MIGRPDRQRSWRDDGLHRRCGWRAAAMVDSAAPLLLVGSPSDLRIDCAVEWVNRSMSRRRSRRQSQRRSWRRSWRGGGRNGGRGLRESCGAAPSLCCAAELLLGWRPISLPLCETRLAIVWQRSRRPTQQPQKKWDQEQQAQKTARRNQASEISARSNNIEIAATADVLVCGLLNVISLAMAHVSQRTLSPM